MLQENLLITKPARKADYYVADVTVAKAEGKIKLTFTFVKVGTGLLRLRKNC